MTKGLIILLFSLSVSMIVAEPIEIPKEIAPLLLQRPGMKNQVVGLSQKDKVTYYVILEPDVEENTQVLIRIDPGDPQPKVMDRLPLMFPLGKYIKDKAIVKDLARQYVQFLITTDPDGKEGIQISLDYNPAAFAPRAPELIEAYKEAGLKIPKMPKPEEEPSPASAK